MPEDFSSKKITLGLLPAVLLTILTVAGVSYSGYRYYLLNKDLIRSKAQFQATSQSLQGSIAELEKHIASTTSENIFLNDFLTVLKARNADYQNEVSEISQRVSTLQKLTSLDPELLQKYSKIYFLNENYIPSDLTLIDPSFLSRPAKPEQIHASVKPYLENLLREARRTGADISVVSAYRSFGTQSALKAQYKVIYGANTANKFSADQGYSEHQLGTTVDFATKKESESGSGFNKSPAYLWLTENAHRFGFILSYPEKNSYYIFEPWHWRFVGVELSALLHKENKRFYDIPERDISAYLIKIFD